MDKKRAIELLRQARSEIPHLRELHYDNQEFKLWRNRVETIIKYGLDEDDYNRLDSVQSKYFPDELEIDHLSLEEDYLPKLNDYEIVLQSIKQKYEILGIEEMPAKAEPPKAAEDYEQRQDKQPFTEAWEIGEAEADVQTLLPLINTVANEQNIPNFALEAQPANSKATNTFAWLDVFIINRTTGVKTPIGVLTLQSLGSNRTILRVPPRSQWLKGDLTPLQLAKMGYIKKDDDAIKFYDACFIQFLKGLDTTLKKYRIKVTFSKRCLQGFKEVLGIYRAVKP